MGVTFYVLIYCLLLVLSTATSWDCRPFEENMPYTLATKWRSTKYDRDKVAWVKNGVIYATCDTDLSCVNYFDHVTEIRTDLNQDGFSWVNLTILNATRREAGVWTLKYIEGIETQASIIEQCNLKSYVKAESVHCNATRATDGVSVQCVVTRVWPQAVCLFNTSLHDTTIKYVKNETHRHELNALTPVYYNTVCSTKVFDEGSFDIDISVFPNFAAGSNDDKYSFRTSFHYNIDNTFVKVDGTSEGREDNNVILINETELSDPGQVPNKAEQFKSVTVDLTPSKPERCDQSSDKYSLHIVCAFVLVLSSSFKCQLLIKTDQGYLQFQTEVTSSEQTSFSPDCMFVVPRTSLKPDTYVATVILVEEGKHHPGNNRSITFQIDIEPTLLANGTSKFIQPASLKSFLLFLLAASVVTLAVICLLAYRFRNVLKSERVRLCVTRSPSIHSGIYEDIDERLSSLSSSTQAREQAYANTTATRTVLSV